MRLTPRIACAALVALALSGWGAQAAVAAGHTAKPTTVVSKVVQAQPSPNPSENGSESEGETAENSDGPGGHADPSTTTDHVFKGKE